MNNETFIVKLPVNKKLLWDVFACVVRRRMLVLSLPWGYVADRVYSESTRKIRRAAGR